MDLSFIKSLPAGQYAAAVSGGADSVAMLQLLLQHRPEVGLHVVHLNHELRGAASTGDAEFVRELSEHLGLTHSIARRSELEGSLRALPSNKSARLRAVRLALYSRVVAEHSLAGVLLAHHADDQAETAFQRLLRGSGYAGMGGMSADAMVGGVRLLRPLLNVPRNELREYLSAIGQAWREDASNTSDEYSRNRLRKLLARHPYLHESIIGLSEACAGVRRWAASAAPSLAREFALADLADLPQALAFQSAREWLAMWGAPKGDLGPGILLALLEMARDAASAARIDFPGGVRVVRRKGRIGVEESSLTPSVSNT